MLLTDLKQMEGKTIRKVATVDLDCTVGFSFTDGSYAFVGVRQFVCGDYEFEMVENPQPHMLRDIGVISPEECERRKR